MLYAILRSSGKRNLILALSVFACSQLELNRKFTWKLLFFFFFIIPLHCPSLPQWIVIDVEVFITRATKAAQGVAICEGDKLL